MAEQDWLAGQFEQNRQHLQAVAYGMLGTVSEAQDAVQEAWLRLGRSDPGGIGDLRGWLTTVVGRISLDMLRARKARREVYPGSWLPEPLVEDSADNGPEGEAVLADIARHPSTAKFIAGKFARHFVADDPPPALVARTR